MNEQQPQQQQQRPHHRHPSPPLHIEIVTPQQAITVGQTWRNDRRHFRRTLKLRLDIGEGWSPEFVEPVLPLIGEAPSLQNLSIECQAGLATAVEPRQMMRRILQAAQVNPRLEKLCLYRMQDNYRVGLALGELLRQSTSLRELRLVDVDVIHEDDVESMTQGLMASESLQTVEFSTYTLNDRATRSLHFVAPILSACVDLAKVRIDSFVWTCECGQILDIMARGSSWRELHLTGCGPETDVNFQRLLDALDQNRFLTTLRLCVVPIVSPLELGQWLSNHQQLQTLELSGNHLEVDGFQVILSGLQSNESVTRLKLQGSFETFYHAEALKNLLIHNQSMERLDLSDSELSEMAWGAIAVGLGKNSKLRELDLSGVIGLSPAGIMSIVAAVQVREGSELRTLKVLGTDLEPEDFDALLHNGFQGENTPLQSLILDLSGQTNAPSCIADNSILANFFRDTNLNRTLRQLSVANNGLQSADLVQLFQALTNDTTLEILTLGPGNWLDRDGFLRLFESFPRMNGLRRLVLPWDDCLLGLRQELLSAAYHSPVLLDLQISNNQFDETFNTSLSYAVKAKTVNVAENVPPALCPNIFSHFGKGEKAIVGRSLVFEVLRIRGGLVDAMVAVRLSGNRRRRASELPS